MARPIDPRLLRSSASLPTPINICPASYSGVLDFGRRNVYPNSNVGPNCNANFCSQFSDPKPETYPEYGAKPEFKSKSIGNNSKSPFLPTPINNCPASYSGVLDFGRRNVYPNFNVCPNYNANFRTECNDLKSESHSEYIGAKPEIQSISIGNDSNFPNEPIDPKLDFCSDSFDPNFFLTQPYDIVKNILPYPKAKEYNNLAQYYSHHILKKDNFKRVEKERLYDRDYAWYYKILGWDHRIQKRYEQRILRRTRKYAGWLTAKLRKYKPRFRNDDPNYEPCRSFPPLQSTKIIQTHSKLRKYKIFPRNLVTDNKESTTENLVSDIPKLNIVEKNTLVSKTGNNSATVITSADSVLSSKNTLMSETINNSTSKEAS